MRKRRAPGLEVVALVSGYLRGELVVPQASGDTEADLLKQNDQRKP